MRSGVEYLPPMTSSCVPGKYRAPTNVSSFCFAARLSSFCASSRRDSSLARAADLESCARATDGRRSRLASVTTRKPRTAFVTASPFVFRTGGLVSPAGRAVNQAWTLPDEQCILLFDVIAPGPRARPRPRSERGQRRLDPLHDGETVAGGRQDGLLKGRDGVVDA